MSQQVEAELQRRDALGALVDWLLVADAEQLVTGLSDPVIDQGVRDRLDVLITALAGQLTDTQLRATPLPVSGTVTATGPLTDTQLRATPVPVSGTVTATGPLTDSQLRATAVPVSGTVTAGNIADLTGTWGYAAGVDGTVTLTGSKRVIGIAAHATTAGSFTINGGDAIPVPANSGIEIVPLANLVDPVIVFSGTDSVFVEHIT